MAMTKDSIISRFNLKEPLYCFFPTFAVFLCKSCDTVTCETIIAMLKLQMTQYSKNGDMEEGYFDMIWKCLRGEKRVLKEKGRSLT